MKKILNIILLMAFSISYSQVIVNLEEKSQHDPFETPKVYYKDVNGVLDKFLGTWKYQDNLNNPTKVFEITFYKQVMRDQGGISFTDEITSNFRYTVNGNIVYDTYTTGQATLIMGSWLSDNNKLELIYSEPVLGDMTTRNKPRGDLHLDYNFIAGQPQPTLTWNVKCYLDENGNSPFQVPLTMVLVKQP